MPTAKITLTLEQDEEMGTNAAMEETIALLASLDTMPTMKLVLTLECADIAAERYREQLRLGLKRRPPGIKIKLTTKTEEEVTCERLPNVTPMDAMLDEVTLSHNGRSVTLTAETARNASAMLRSAGDENLFNDDGAE